MSLTPDPMHQRLVKLVRTAEKKRRQLDRAIASFRREHPDLEDLMPTVLHLLRTGAVPVTGDTAADLEHAYEAAKSKLPR